jgi:hypothetical protein
MMLAHASRCALLLLGCAPSCAPEAAAPPEVPFAVTLQRSVSTAHFDAEIIDATLVGDSLLVLIAGGGRQLLANRREGDSLRVIASSGSGPCEIEGATGLVALSDSSFALSDATTFRIQVRTVSGCLREVSSGAARPSQLFLSRDGVLVRGRRARSATSELLRLDSDSLVVVTTLPSSSDPSQASCFYCRLAVLRDGSTYTATGSDSLYRILHFSEAGTLVQTIQREHVSLARVLERDSDSIASLYQRMLAGPMSAAAKRGLEQAIQQAPRQTARPLFQRGPLVDESAGLLLAPRWPETGNPLPVDIFSLSAAKFLGTMNLPEGTLLLRATEHGVLGVQARGDSVVQFTVFRALVK